MAGRPALSSQERLSRLKVEAQRARYRSERIENLQDWLLNYAPSGQPTNRDLMPKWYWITLYILAVAPPLLNALLLNTLPQLHSFSTLWLVPVISLVLGWVGVAMGLATPDDWRKRTRKETFLRWLPLQVAILLILAPSCLEGRWHTFLGFPFDFIRFALAVAVTLLALMLWQTQFQVLGKHDFLEDVDVQQQKLEEAAWQWVENEALRAEIHRSERRTDWYFALFAAITLNSFALVGSLKFPPVYIALTSIAAAILTIMWLFTLSRWRIQQRSTSYGLGDGVPWITVLLVGFVLFAVQGGLASTANDSPIVKRFADGLDRNERLLEGTPWKIAGSDVTIFAIQLLIVVLTTSLPIFAAWWYRRSLSVVLDDRGFAYSLNGREFLQVDQVECTFTPLDVKAPRFGFTAVTEIIDGYPEDVYLVSRWKTESRFFQPRLKYDYSILIWGDTFCVLGVERVTKRHRIEWGQRLRGNEKGALPDSWGYKVVPGGNGERTPDQKSFQIADYRVPPVLATDNYRNR